MHEETKGMFWRLNRVWGGDVGMWREVLEGGKEVTLKEWENGEKKEDADTNYPNEGRIADGQL